MNKLLLALLAVLAVASLFDAQVAQAAASVRTPVLDAVFLFFSGITTLYFGIIIIFVLALAWHSRAFWSLLAAFVIDAALVLVLKVGVARPRPAGEAAWWLDAELQSFPSGHASRAFALFGVLSHFFKKSTTLLYAVAFLTAVSRVYFGVHYASDVFAGALLGAAVSEAVMRLKLGERIENAYARLKKKSRVRKGRRPWLR